MKKKLRRDNSYFLIPYLAFLTAGGYLLLTVQKGAILLWLNAKNTPFWDNFFKYTTYFGEGLTICIIFLLFFILYKTRYSLYIFLGYATSGILAQIIKRIANTPRPKRFFGDSISLHFVSGVAVYSYNSFPSGHSATAFSFFFVLSIITKNKPFGLIYFVAALLVGISRIYLVEHFFVDVYFGSILGVICTIIVYLFLYRSKKAWMDKSLLKILFNEKKEQLT